MNTEKQNNLEPANDENFSVKGQPKQEKLGCFQSVIVFLKLCFYFVVGIMVITCVFEKNNETPRQTTQTATQPVDIPPSTNYSSISTANDAKQEAQSANAKSNDEDKLVSALDKKIKKMARNMEQTGNMSSANFLPIGNSSGGLGDFMNRHNLKFTKFELDMCYYDDEPCYLWTAITRKGRPSENGQTYCGVVVNFVSTKESGFKVWKYREGNVGGQILGRGDEFWILNKIDYESERLKGC